jgi:hypothetical protein
MSFGSACYTFSPVIKQPNYDYLIVGFDGNNYPSYDNTSNIIDSSIFHNNLLSYNDAIWGNGDNNKPYLQINTPFSNTNLEYGNKTQELFVSCKFNFFGNTYPYNIFRFNTDSNGINYLRGDIISSTNFNVSYSNSNIGSFSLTIDPTTITPPFYYYLTVSLYKTSYSNIINYTLSNDNIYNNVSNFIPLHNIFDNYHKNSLFNGSLDLQLYTFNLYNKLTV